LNSMKKKKQYVKTTSIEILMCASNGHFTIPWGHEQDIFFIFAYLSLIFPRREKLKINTQLLIFFCLHSDSEFCHHVQSKHH